MPRSPAEGASTRSVADLEVARTRISPRDRRVRSGVDRRQRDVGPPNGVERRKSERRAGSRRAGVRADRRVRDRRELTVSRSARAEPGRPGERLSARRYDPASFPRTGTPRLLRLAVVVAIAVGCLLAATLTGQVDDAGAAALTAAAGTPGSTKATKGGITATLSWQRRTSGQSFGAVPIYGALRLGVRGKGRSPIGRGQVLGAKLRAPAGESWGAKPTVALADVNGDGILDPIASLYTGGAHCCSVSATAPSTTRGWSQPLVHSWGNSGFEVRDVGGTAQAEFVTRDERFVSAWSSYAATRAPVQIKRLKGRKLVDVTREFPDHIRRDAAEQSQAWTDAATLPADVRAEAGRTAAAAWIADLAMLGDLAGAKAVVDASRARGDFSGNPGFGLSGQIGYDLEDWGYLTDPEALGLSTRG